MDAKEAAAVDAAALVVSAIKTNHLLGRRFPKPH